MYYFVLHSLTSLYNGVFWAIRTDIKQLFLKSIILRAILILTFNEHIYTRDIHIVAKDDLDVKAIVIYVQHHRTNSSKVQSNKF